MDKKALQLCSRFALQPNLLGYCGRSSAPVKLYECVVNGNCEGVRQELEKFIVLNPYLQTIAQITSKNPFSYEVIEAYWLGNDLLNQIKPEHYPILINNLAKQGVPEFLIEEIKNKKPKEFIPIHLFNILHVGVGKASGSVPFNLESINNCMVRWGEVKLNVKSQKSKQEQGKPSFFKEGRQAQHGREILTPLVSTPLIRGDARRSIAEGFDKTTNYQLLTIDTIKLTQKNGKYKLVESEEEVPYLPQLVGNLKIGDKVAVHWGWVAGKLNENEKLKMQKWTERLINTIAIWQILFSFGFLLHSKPVSQLPKSLILPVESAVTSKHG